MQDLLATLYSEAALGGWITTFFLVLARWVPLVILAPFFAAKAMPASARIGIALALTVLVLPAAHQAAGTLPSTGMSLALLVLRETLIGALIGLFVSIPFYALEAGGRLIDSVRGARMAEVMAAPTAVRASPTGALLLLLGVVLFMAVDGHLLVISAVGQSYRTLPVGGALAADAPARVIPLALHLSAQLFLVAVGIAAPVIAATILVDLSLGMAGRVAPRLQLYFLGLPIKAMGGVALLLLTLTVMLWSIGGLFRLTIRSVSAAFTALGG